MSQIANTAAADYHARRSRPGLESASKTQNWEDRATRYVSNKAIFTTSASADVQKTKKKSTDQIIWIKDVFARHLAAKEDFSPANSDLNTHNCILMSTDLFLMAIFFPCISFFSFSFTWNQHKRIWTWIFWRNPQLFWAVAPQYASHQSLNKKFEIQRVKSTFPPRTKNTRETAEKQSALSENASRGGNVFQQRQQLCPRCWNHLRALGLLECDYES